jgi:Fe-Mn family superoxide dismutase
MAFQLPSLPYSHGALEPHIDQQTMEIHHGKHHQAYVDNLNKAIAGTEHESKSLMELVKNAGSISPAVRNNGGGHWNHSFFWETLTPNSTAPSGALLKAIEETFGSVDAMKEKVAEAGATRFGSGWAWLGVDSNKKLVVGSTPNQDNPYMDVSDFKCDPILGIDVWEHAYYLKYQNKRPDYLKAIWNVINWDKVAERYNEFVK